MITTAAAAAIQAPRRLDDCSSRVLDRRNFRDHIEGNQLLDLALAVDLAAQFFLAESEACRREPSPPPIPAPHSMQTIRLVRFYGKIRRIQHAEMFALLRFLQVGRHFRLVLLGQQRFVIGLRLIIVARDVRELLFHHRSHIQPRLVLVDLRLLVFDFRLPVRDFEAIGL